MTTEATVETQIPTIRLTEEDEEDTEEAEEGNAMMTGDAVHPRVTDAEITETITDGMIGTETEGEGIMKTENEEALLLEETEMKIDVETTGETEEMTDDTETARRMTIDEGEVDQNALRIKDKRKIPQITVGLFQVNVRLN